MHGQRADDRASTGFVSETVHERLQLRPDRRRRRSVSNPRRCRLRLRPQAIEARQRKDRDRCSTRKVPACERDSKARRVMHSTPVRDTGRSSAGRSRRARCPSVPTHSGSAADTSSSTTKRGRLLAGTALLERQQHCAGSATPGRIGRPPTLRSTRWTRRQRHLEEAALVVADGVARLDQEAPSSEAERRDSAPLRRWR